MIHGPVLKYQEAVVERYKIDKEKKSDVEYVGDMIELMRSNDPEANKVRCLYAFQTLDKEFSQQFKRMLYERALAYLYGENLISEGAHMCFLLLSTYSVFRRSTALQNGGEQSTTRPVT